MMIGTNVRHARKVLGLSLRALSERIGSAGRVAIDHTALHRIESGARKVSSSELVELAIALETSTGALLGSQKQSASLALAARVSETVPGDVYGQGAQRAIEVLEVADLLARLIGPLPSTPGFRFEAVPRTPAGGQKLAAMVRSELGLGSGPIADLTSLIESSFGAHVLHEALPSATHGFCVVGGDASVIIVNSTERVANGSRSATNSVTSSSETSTLAK
jgi:transcriptional regulator with XRE-family HTH domain